MKPLPSSDHGAIDGSAFSQKACADDKVIRVEGPLDGACYEASMFEKVKDLSVLE